MKTYHSTMEAKYETARRHGAAGVLMVSDPEKSGTFSIFRTFAELGARSLPSPLGERTLAIAGLLTVQAMERILQSPPPGLLRGDLRARARARRIGLDSEIRASRAPMSSRA
jgi:hypothetical protein